MGVLEVPDGLAKSLAIFDVVNRHIERFLDCGARAHCDDQAFLRQFAHQLIEPTTLDPAEHILTRDKNIVEEQFRCVGGIHPDLVELFAAFEPVRAICFQQHKRDTFGALVRIGFGDHHDKVGGLTVGDIGFGAVDPVAIAILQSRGGDRLQIRSNPGLGHRNCADQFARYQFGQIFLLLLFGPVAHQIGQDNGVVQAGGEAIDIVLRLLVNHHHVVPEIAAMAAIFLWHGHTQQAGSTCLVPKFAFNLAIVAPCLHPLFGCVLLVKFADRIGEDRNLFVVHEGGLGYINDRHITFPSNWVRAFQQRQLRLRAHPQR